MLVRRSPHAVQAALAMLFWVALLNTVSAAPLRVRGTPSFRAVRTQPMADGGYQLMGYLRDGFDQPLPRLAITLHGAPAAPCDAGTDVSGPDGEFCFHVKAPAGTAVTLRVVESAFLSPGEGNFTLDPTMARFSLLLHLERDELDLNQATHPLRIQLETASAGREAYPVRLQVVARDEQRGTSTERFSQLKTVSAIRSANFVLDAAALGPPGPLLLVAEISVADRLLARAERSVTLVDTATLQFVSELGPVRPASGFAIAVSVQGRGGAVSSGWVEASVGGTPVGLAKVEQGQAIVESRFQALRSEQLPLSLRYVPEHPWFRAGPPLTTTLQVLPPPWWSHAPWVLLATIAGYWVLRAWRRPRRQREAVGLVSARPQGAAAVLVRGEREANAWTGQVIDAHTGAPVGGATLRVEVPSVSEVHLASQATTDAAGFFVLPKVARLPENASLVVTAREHSELRQAMPPLGELRVALMERRRSVLQTLARWAKEMGPPWLAGEAPTPAHVANLARQKEKPETHSWALAVEAAAYGPQSPDDEEEQRLLRAAPPLDRSTPHKR